MTLKIDSSTGEKEKEAVALEDVDINGMWDKFKIVLLNEEAERVGKKVSEKYDVEADTETEIDEAIFKIWEDFGLITFIDNESDINDRIMIIQLTEQGRNT